MNYHHLRVHCLDCAAPMFVIGTDGEVCTRCERCARKYAQQIYLLREFLARA